MKTPLLAHAQRSLPCGRLTLTAACLAACAIALSWASPLFALLAALLIAATACFGILAIGRMIDAVRTANGKPNDAVRPPTARYATIRHERHEDKQPRRP